MNKKKNEKMKEKMRCTPMKLKVGDGEIPGYVCLLGKGDDVSINVVSKEKLKKVAKKAIEKEK